MEKNIASSRIMITNAIISRPKRQREAGNGVDVTEYKTSTLTLSGNKITQQTEEI